MGEERGEGNVHVESRKIVADPKSFAPLARYMRQFKNGAPLGADASPTRHRIAKKIGKLWPSLVHKTPNSHEVPCFVHSPRFGSSLRPVDDPVAPVVRARCPQAFHLGQLEAESSDQGRGCTTRHLHCQLDHPVVPGC